jgi:hypothetical protein
MQIRRFGETEMKHRLLFGDLAFYEAAMVDILQKYPWASGVAITIHEAGKR